MTIAQSVGVEESTPRLASRQQHRPAQSPTDYYRLNLTIPLLDHLINEIELRYSSQNVTEFLALLPATISKSHSVIDRGTLPFALQVYENDLPASLSLDTDLDLWQQHWIAHPNLASQLNAPEKALHHADKDFYPNINVLLRIMATLPVTICECECSISFLRLVKLSLCSSMGQNRCLALLHSNLFKLHFQTFKNLQIVTKAKYLCRQVVKQLLCIVKDESKVNNLHHRTMPIM